MDQRLLHALQCRNQQTPPIWLMRQAGRYMPEYRSLRARYSFLELCHQPELAAQITLMPIKTFDFDAAIVFSDILVVGETFGLTFHFEEGEGPVFHNPLQTSADVEALCSSSEIVSQKLNYVAETIRLLRPQLKVPLLGFCGAPFTLASYFIEGKSSHDLKRTKQWMLREPTSFHLLLSKIADASIAYIKLQVAAGVQAVQIFDSWAHALGHSQFREFSLAYLQRILVALKDLAIPVILFCRGASVFAQQLAEISPAAVSIDWQADLAYLRRHIPSNIALQGNLDPDILYADLKTIRKEAQRLLNSMQGEPGYIFNLGHGVKPDTPVDAVKTLVESVKSWTPHISLS